MSLIVISARELTNKKEALTALKKKLETQVNQFEAEAKKLDSMWEGEAKNKYRTAINLDISKIRLFIQIVVEFISVLSMIINTYQQMESKNAATASS